LAPNRLDGSLQFALSIQCECENNRAAKMIA